MSIYSNQRTHKSPISHIYRRPVIKTAQNPKLTPTPSSLLNFNILAGQATPWLPLHCKNPFTLLWTNYILFENERVKISLNRNAFLQMKVCFWRWLKKHSSLWLLHLSNAFSICLPLIFLFLIIHYFCLRFRNKQKARFKHYQSLKSEQLQQGT